jgi:UDP-glucose 4-epimerase
LDIAGKKLAVIGGAGFVGSHIVDQLCTHDVASVLVIDDFVRGKPDNLANVQGDSRVRVVKGSITDQELLRRELADIDGVFLLAALWLGECVDNPRHALDVNVVGTFNVIEACRDLGVQRLVFSSSASVYGDAVTVPMTEDHPFNNRTMYGATKIAGEQILRAFYEMYKLPYIGYRYMNVYGPRMDYKGTYVSVIMRVLDRIAQGERPVIFGDGSQSYDFVHVTDVARANILGMKSDVADEFFNIGVGVRTTINELVHLLLTLTNSTLEPEHRPQKQYFVQHRVGSTDKAEQLLGFKGEKSLEDGLREVIRWRISQGLNLRLLAEAIQ